MEVDLLMKKPGFAIMIAANSKKQGPPVQGPQDKMKPQQPQQEKEEMEESPKQEAAEHSMDGKYVPPESVGYHDSTETCSACEYNSEQGCSWLGFEPDPGGHCSLFGEKESE